MKRTFSITEWCQLAKDGTSIPMHITLKGGSMFPLIRFGRDYVTIMPNNDELHIGDIVLFSQQTLTSIYVVHRIWDLKDDMVLTWGDNTKSPDGWIPTKEILGKVVLIERGRKKIQPDPIKGMKWARFWHQAGKVYRIYKRYKDGLVRRINKVRTRGAK